MNIRNLVHAFSKLPNLGPSSSRRLVIHLLQNKEKVMLPLASLIRELADLIIECKICGNLDIKSPCSICINPKRDTKLMCVVEELGDLWTFEKGNIYSGMYHVLGGRLSAINGIGPKELNLDNIPKRVTEFKIEEVIIAINPTLEGQVTAQYIIELLKNSNVKISRLACGIPIGGEIDYLDEGTLKIALTSRQDIK
ncbi:MULTISPECIES: recombination mediator RecR [Wolbachia]|uniref:recombination mediator RecR n=1 Tax=Wolbachia TaxID=953 RepID=UPI001BA8E8F9|nr:MULTISPECIES: recombination mediator RecR [unclassified Wolbachia]QUI60917.1 recombination protein RecR [Wolbachia endosymbiont of Spodoptera picta]URG40515.1 recombination mediator RecR [Wolbachia endosymbiont of Ostrinia furnacalis]URG41560.1 recombination mediator RecR [Wolbachia endosymbiont of Ostrinia scapulalis]